MEEAYSVKADKNFHSEPYELKNNQIQGKVIKVIKNMGFLINIIQSKTVFIIDTILLIIIAYNKIKSIVKLNKRRKKQKKTHIPPPGSSLPSLNRTAPSRRWQPIPADIPR